MKLPVIFAVEVVFALLRNSADVMFENDYIAYVGHESSLVLAMAAGAPHRNAGGGLLGWC